MSKKNVYNEFVWDNLAKRLKYAVDTLARRQRQFDNANISALDTYIKNNVINEDLFKITEKGYISKGVKFYKDKNITYLQRAIAELEKLNSHKLFKSVKSYTRIYEKQNISIRQYIFDEIYAKTNDFEMSKKISEDPNIVEELRSIMNNNAHSKMSSDNILSPMFDSYIEIEKRALNQAINDTVNAEDTTHRLYER